MGAAAEVEAAGRSAAPTASRVPLPDELLQEAGVTPQAPCASSVNDFLWLAIHLILLLVLLTWRLLGDDACAEAVTRQELKSASMRVQVDSLVPTARDGAPMSRAAVPAARHSSARLAAKGCLPEPGVEAHPDVVGCKRLNDPMSSTPVARGAAGCDTTRGSGINAPSGPAGPGGGESQAALSTGTLETQCKRVST